MALMPQESPASRHQSSKSRQPRLCPLALTGAAGVLLRTCAVQGGKKNNVSRLRESSLEVFANAAQADIADDKSDQSITSFLHGFSGQLMQPTLYQQIDVLEETCI